MRLSIIILGAQLLEILIHLSEKTLYKTASLAMEDGKGPKGQQQDKCFLGSRRFMN